MIRLAKLPERNPVKLSISVPPALHEALIAYAAAYAKEYGSEEPVTELTMLTAFLESDRAFAKARARHASSSMERKRS